MAHLRGQTGLSHVRIYARGGLSSHTQRQKIYAETARIRRGIRDPV